MDTTYQTFRHDFRVFDLMSITKFKNELKSENENSNRKVFIDVSNAFNYEINSILYSKNIIRDEKQLLEFL